MPFCNNITLYIDVCPMPWSKNKNNRNKSRIILAVIRYTISCSLIKSVSILGAYHLFGSALVEKLASLLPNPANLQPPTHFRTLETEQGGCESDVSVFRRIQSNGYSISQYPMSPFYKKGKSLRHLFSWAVFQKKDELTLALSNHTRGLRAVECILWSRRTMRIQLPTDNFALHS